MTLSIRRAASAAVMLALAVQPAASKPRRLAAVHKAIPRRLPTGVAPPTYFPNGPIKGVNGLAAAAVASDITTLLGYVPLNPANNLTDVANPATARGSLGAAANGSNSDITALLGLTTALSASEGGTGVTAMPAGLLKGSGSALAAAAAADITTLLGFVPLKPTNNLSDVQNAATALANLGGCALTGCAFTGLVSNSGSAAGFRTGDRNGTGYGQFYRTTGENILFDSVGGNVFTYDATSISLSQPATVYSTLPATATTSAAFAVRGGLGVVGDIIVGGKVTTPSLTIAQTFASGTCTPSSYFTLQDSGGTSHKVPAC